MLSLYLRLGSCDLSHECYMPTHLITLYFIILITFGDAYKLYDALHCAVLLSLLLLLEPIEILRGKGHKILIKEIHTEFSLNN